MRRTSSCSPARSATCAPSPPAISRRWWRSSGRNSRAASTSSAPPREIRDLLSGVMPEEQPPEAVPEPDAEPRASDPVWDKIAADQGGGAAGLPDQGAPADGGAHPLQDRLGRGRQGARAPSRRLSLRAAVPDARHQARGRRGAGRGRGAARQGARRLRRRRPRARGIADILNRLDKTQSEAVLQSLAEVRPDEAKALKSLLFSFEDLADLPPPARTAVFDQVPIERLVLALKGTDPTFQAAILSALASRSRRMVEAELQGGGTAPARERGRGAPGDRRHRPQDGRQGRHRAARPAAMTSATSRPERAAAHGRRTRQGQQDRGADREEDPRRLRARLRSLLARGGNARLAARHARHRRASSWSAASPISTSSLRRLLDNPGGWSLENSADADRPVPGDRHGCRCRLLLPAVVVLAAAGILSSLLQNAPRLVLERMRPQLSRLSISKGWKRIFGAQGQIEFLKSLFKLVAIALARLPAAALGPARRRRTP